MGAEDARRLCVSALGGAFELRFLESLPSTPELIVIIVTLLSDMLSVVKVSLTMTLVFVLECAIGLYLWGADDPYSASASFEAT